jgi:hypothetical protein
VRGSSEGVSDAQSSTVPTTMPVLESGMTKRLIHLNVLHPSPWFARAV